MLDTGCWMLAARSAREEEKAVFFYPVSRIEHPASFL
jgi:hypothetical protein